MRTDRGVGFRPIVAGASGSGSLALLGPGSLNMPATEWMVEQGAGPGGRLGSHDGYPSELKETPWGDWGEDVDWRSDTGVGPCVGPFE